MWITYGVRGTGLRLAASLGIKADKETYVLETFSEQKSSTRLTNETFLY